MVVPRREGAAARGTVPGNGRAEAQGHHRPRPDPLLRGRGADQVRRYVQFWRAPQGASGRLPLNAVSPTFLLERLAREEVVGAEVRSTGDARLWHPWLRINRVPRLVARLLGRHRTPSRAAFPTRSWN